MKKKTEQARGIMTHMHEFNRVFWATCAADYPEYFDGAGRVLEVGSMDVNGSIREYFKDIGTYIGVDWHDLTSLRQRPCWSMTPNGAGRSQTWSRS